MILSSVEYKERARSLFTSIVVYDYDTHKHCLCRVIQFMFSTVIDLALFFCMNLILYTHFIFNFKILDECQIKCHKMNKFLNYLEFELKQLHRLYFYTKFIIKILFV